MEHILFSVFDGLSSVRPTQITFQQMLELVKNNATVKRATELHRQYLAEGKKAAADSVKKSSCCMSVSVVFEGGKSAKHITGWTSIGMVDLDHLPNERMNEVLQAIRQDPYTLVCFNTISNQGIRIFYRYSGLTDDATVNHQVHEFVFTAINRHYAELTGVKTDLKCKNATRLTVLAHDPHVYFNPRATVCDYAKLRTEADIQQKTKAKTQRQYRTLQVMIKAAQAILEKRGVKYEAHHHDEYISQLGLLLNEYGAQADLAVAWAKDHFTDYPDAARIMTNCFRKTEEHGTRVLVKENSRNGASVAEIKEYLNQKALFRKNTITSLTELSTDLEHPQWKEMTDREINSLWTSANLELGHCRINDLRLLLESNFVPLYHPFRDYIARCGEWDGQTDYIDQLASMVHTQTPHEEEFFHHQFKKWFVGMVASLLYDDVVNNQILLLIGPQGIYKTSWLNKLLPPELSRYFCLKCDSRTLTKDDRLSLAEFAIICLEEVDNVEGNFMSQIKSMTTLPKITERAAYARYKEVRPHIASLAGTSNYHLILCDLEGNRRWLPIDVAMIDNPYEATFNYQGIYAQAAYLAQDTKNFVLTREEIELVNEHNHDFEMPCPERDLIQTYFRRSMPGEEAKFLSNAEILIILSYGLHYPLSPVKIGQMMKKLGYESVKVGGKRGYLVIQLDPERIALNSRSLAKDAKV